ncbi:MAG: hypothetical protein WCG07_00215 [Candidatus Taylorbacteria bacterium]
MKTSKVLCNMNTQLKKAAMAKAHKEGWTLSAFINFATRAYVQNRLSLEILDPDMAQGLDDIKHGRVFTMEDMMKDLELRRRREK